MKKYLKIVGIDVSKSKLDFCLYSKDAAKHCQVKNDESGFKRMIFLIEEFVSVNRVLFCMEHTGVYTYPLCHFLADQKFHYTLIPAVQIKKSLGIQRGKNDHADAKAIARYGHLFQSELSIQTLPEKSLMKLKMLLTYRERLINAKRAFLVPTGELKQFGDPCLATFVIEENEAFLEQIKQRIERVDKEIEQTIQFDEMLKKTFDLCVSVPGVGPQIAAFLIVTTRCFKAFNSSRKYACYAGVAPFEYRSGSSVKGRTKVSHLANKRAKSLISMGSIIAIRFDRELNAYYQRKVKEGKSKMSVINAVRNKLLARVFATVNRGTPFKKIANY